MGSGRKGLGRPTVALSNSTEAVLGVSLFERRRRLQTSSRSNQSSQSRGTTSPSVGAGSKYIPGGAGNFEQFHRWVVTALDRTILEVVVDDEDMNVARATAGDEWPGRFGGVTR
jgi:hypothetical protein